MIQQQGIMIDRLMTDRFDAVNVMTDMMMRMANNQHELRMKELEREQSNATRQALMSLAPALINTFTGTDVFPQSTADSALIDAAAKHATPEMMAKLLDLGLPDTVMAAFADRIMKARKAQEEEAAKTNRLPPFNGKPEDDVNGGGGE